MWEIFCSGKSMEILVDGLGLVGRQADDQVVLAALGEHAVVGQEVAGALGFHIVKLDAEVFFRLLGAGVGHIVEVLVAQAAGGQDDAHLQGIAVRGAAGGAGRWGVLAAAAGGQAEGEGTGQREREQFLCVHDRVPPITMYLRSKARQPAVSFSASLPKLLE